MENPDQNEEIRLNKLAYDEHHREELEREHFGRTAVMSAGELIAVYNDFDDAYQIAVEKFGLGHFALIEIGEAPGQLSYSLTTLV